MKKLYTIIVALLINNMITYAQPVINSTDFSASYDLYSYSADNNISGLSPGGAGANQTWNFSAMTATSDKEKLSVVPVASTPYATDFPTANFVFKFTGLEDGYVDYSYYKVSSTTFESVGSKAIDYTELDIDPYVFIKLPYTYTTVFTDSYQSESDVPNSYTFTSTYDGYGTLITPYDIYTNVIRQKRVEVDGNSTSTEYIWMTANPFKMVMWMEIHENSTDNIYGNSTSFYSGTNLGVKESNKEKLISVYPNPTTSKLNLHFSNNKTIDKVVIIDVTGKIVKQQTENTAQINVEKLVTGLYVIEAYSGAEKFQTKFIKE
jgi:hypothetical protein